MAYVLHIVPRWDRRFPQVLATSLLHSGSPDKPVRLLELFEPGPEHVCVDLSLSVEDMPELMTILQDVAEVHVHQVHLKTVLWRLPYVVPEVLSHTPLFLHGPWGEPFAEYPGERVRLTNWPGPVYSDFPAGELPEGVTAQPTARVLLWDHQDPCLLPRECESPLLRDGERRWVRVLLYPHLAEELKECLAAALTGLTREGLEVEVITHALNNQREFLEIQRTCQLVVVQAGHEDGPRPLALVHALLQHVKVLLLSGENEAAYAHELPDAVTILERHEGEEAAALATRCAAFFAPYLNAPQTLCSRDWEATDSWVQSAV